MQKRGNIKSDEKMPKYPKIKAKNVRKKQEMTKKNGKTARICCIKLQNIQMCQK